MPEPIRVALLYANPLVDKDPSGYIVPVVPLDYSDEQRQIIAALREAGRIAEFRAETATVENLRKLLTLGYSVIHYTGHGDPSFLLFEDGAGAAHAVDPQMLTELITAGDRISVRLAFVSACYSYDSARALIEAGVPHVVAVREDEAVGDLAARIFANAFYLALATAHSVRGAFQIAHASVANCPELHNEALEEAGRFILLPEDEEHDEVLFQSVEHGEFVDRTPAEPATNLPAPGECFVGRNLKEQEVVRELLESRFVTIRGAPGIGKTTLAVHAAHYLSERRRYSDGVLFVELRGAKSAEAVWAAIASAINEVYGFTIHSEVDVRAALKQREVLLLLDNCEDPLQYAARELRDVLNRLVGTARGVRILATSRAALEGTPLAPERIIHLRQLDRLQAAKLLIQLAPRELKVDEIGERDAEDPKREWGNLPEHPVVALLSGHPLAISLAAPLLVDRTLEQLYQLLKDQVVDRLYIEAIPEEERDVTTSLGVSLAVSTGYVNQRYPEAIRLFGVLGLLPGGALPFDLDKIWGENWQELIGVLVRASLVERRIISTDNTEHFYTLPIITRYAESFLQADEKIEYSHRVISHFAKASRVMYAGLQTQNAERVFGVFSLQEANLWPCLDTGRASPSERDSSGMTARGTVATYLPQILHLAGRPEDANRAATLGRDACKLIGDTIGEAYAEQALGELYVSGGQYQEASECYEAALKKHREAGSSNGVIDVLDLYGSLKLRLRDTDGAEGLLSEALTLVKDADYREGKANVLLSLGHLREMQDRLSEADDQLSEALTVYEEMGQGAGRANALRSRAAIRIRQGNTQDARADYSEALRLSREQSYHQGVANALLGLAEVEVRQGNLSTALVLCNQASTQYQEIGDGLGAANSFRELADIASRQGQADQAGSALARAFALHADHGDVLGVGSDLGLMERIFNREQRFVEAALYSDLAVTLHQRIGDMRGVGLHLLEQAKAFGQMGALEAAYSALWEARTVLLPVGDAALALANQWVARIEDELGTTEYERLVELLEEDAGTRRSKAVASLKEMLSADDQYWSLERTLLTFFEQRGF